MFALEALQFPRYQDIFEEAVGVSTVWLNKLNEGNVPCDDLHKSLSKKRIGRWFMFADNMSSSFFFNIILKRSAEKKKQPKKTQ